MTRGFDETSRDGKPTWCARFAGDNNVVTHMKDDNDSDNTDSLSVLPRQLTKHESTYINRY